MGSMPTPPIQQAPTPPVITPPQVMPIKDPIADTQAQQRTQAGLNRSKTTRANTIIGSDDTLG